MVTRIVPETPGELLAAADRILTCPPASPSGGDEEAHRTCARLIGLALETVLDGYWRRIAPPAVRCSMRAQLLLLPEFIDIDTVTLARHSWHGLSRPCELPPTAAELRGWHADVTAVTASLS